MCSVLERMIKLLMSNLVENSKNCLISDWCWKFILSASGRNLFLQTNVSKRQKDKWVLFQQYWTSFPISRQVSVFQILRQIIWNRLRLWQMIYIAQFTLQFWFEEKLLLYLTLILKKRAENGGKLLFWEEKAEKSQGCYLGLWTKVSSLMLILIEMTLELMGFKQSTLGETQIVCLAPKKFWSSRQTKRVGTWKTGTSI